MLDVIENEPLAIKKIVDLKGRDPENKFSIAVAGIEYFGDVFKIDAKQKMVLKSTLPGPYTYILPLLQKGMFSEISDGNSVGVRVPDHPLTLALCEAVNIPLITTSANLSKRENAGDIQAIPGIHTGEVDFVIDSGKITEPTGSTIIRFSSKGFAILREGAVSLTQFQKIWDGII